MNGAREEVIITKQALSGCGRIDQVSVPVLQGGHVCYHHFGEQSRSHCADSLCSVRGQSSDTSFCLQSCLYKSMLFSAKVAAGCFFFLFVLFYVSGLRFDVNPLASVLCVYNCVCLCLWRSEIDILRVSSVFLNHSPPYFVCVHVSVRCVWHLHTRVDR